MAIRNNRRINKVRNFAITLVLLGFVIMYAGIFFHDHKYIMIIGLVFGGILFVGSTLIYSYIGIIALNQVPVNCPSCGKETRMLGKADLCIHCNEALTLDRNLEGKDYVEYSKTLRKPRSNNSARL